MKTCFQSSRFSNMRNVYYYKN